MRTRLHASRELAGKEEGRSLAAPPSNKRKTGRLDLEVHVADLDRRTADPDTLAMGGLWTSLEVHVAIWIGEQPIQTLW